MTRQMRLDLAALGYSKDDISHLTPSEALTIIQTRRRKWSYSLSFAICFLKDWEVPAMKWIGYLILECQNCGILVVFFSSSDRFCIEQTHYVLTHQVLWPFSASLRIIWSIFRGIDQEYTKIILLDRKATLFWHHFFLQHSFLTI